MRSLLITLALLTVCLTPVARAEIVITEIMYNPSGTEPDSEWIEIFNTGPVAVDLTGWSFLDEDAGMGGTLGSVLQPGQALVVVDSDSTTAAAFATAWGISVANVEAVSWGSFALSNSPSATNEILELQDNVAATIDIVNYDDAFGWPGNSNGLSIYLSSSVFPSTAANDIGTNWAQSAASVDGAFAIPSPGGIYGAGDVASPGFHAVPEPSALALMALAGLALAGRRRRA